MTHSYITWRYRHDRQCPSSLQHTSGTIGNAGQRALLVLSLIFEENTCFRSERGQFSGRPTVALQLQSFLSWQGLS